MVRALIVGFALGIFACGDGTSGDDSAGAGAGGAGGAGASGAGASSGTGTQSGAQNGTQSSGTAGGVLPECVTEAVLIAEQGKNFECEFALADEEFNLVLEVGGSNEVICWRGSSQGCDSAGFGGGWWWSGDEVWLCDTTCAALIETPGAKLHAWYGCGTDTCL